MYFQVYTAGVHHRHWAWELHLNDSETANYYSDMPGQHLANQLLVWFATMDINVLCKWLLGICLCDVVEFLQLHLWMTISPYIALRPVEAVTGQMADRKTAEGDCLWAVCRRCGWGRHCKDSTETGTRQNLLDMELFHWAGHWVSVYKLVF